MIGLLSGLAASTALIATPAAPSSTSAVEIADTANQPQSSPSPAIEKLATPDQPVGSSGKLKLGGAIRGRYDLRFNNVGASGQRRTSSNLSFDTLILTADYDSSVFFASAQYRFYGGSFLYGKASGYKNYPGEVNFPVYAYAGAKLTAHDKVTVGIQSVPFDDRFWGSAFLNSLGFVYGLEEVYDAGIAFSHTGSHLSVDVGFFPTTAPNALGISADSARYSINIVKGDPSLPGSSRNAERNIAVGRLQYQLPTAPSDKLVVSASAWISTIHNFDTNQDGHRHAFALSVKDQHGPWHIKVLGAYQDIDPRNPLGQTETVSVGDYDSPFNIAARSKIVFTEIGRSIDTGKLPFNVDLYASYARAFKDTGDFKDTQRINLGAYWTDKATKRIRVWSEVLIGKHDPYVGAGQYGSAAAQGASGGDKVSFLTVFGYYF
jgi:hypothetical protein